MKDYEDEAFDELEKSLQRKVATGVTDGNNGCGGVERMRMGANGITWRGPNGEITMRLDDAGLRIAKPLNADGNKKDAALRLAREALKNSVDLVSNEAREAESLYGKYPSRLARVQGLVALEVAHQAAIKAIDEALEDK